MSFYEKYEYLLQSNSMIVDYDTSDILYNANYNSNYLITTLNEFYDKRSIDIHIMEEFNEELYQRVVYENLIEYGEPDARVLFTMLKEFPVDYNIPFGYEYAHEYNSIIDSGITFINFYLNDKFEFFDFTNFNNKVLRMNTFEVFNFSLKMMNVLDCTLYSEIQNNLDNLMDLLDDSPIKEKINKIKDKAYVAVIWNNLLNYLSKCNSDLHECFISQSWEFINDYITKRI